MIVNENTKYINITEVLLIQTPSFGNLAHTFTIHKDVLDGEVHWVVEETRDIVLIVANVTIITIEDFSHLEDTCRLAIFAPEVLGNLRNGVDTDAIESIFLNQVVDPVLEVLSHIRVSLVEVW